MHLVGYQKQQQQQQQKTNKKKEEEEKKNKKVGLLFLTGHIGRGTTALQDMRHATYFERSCGPWISLAYFLVHRRNFVV